MFIADERTPIMVKSPMKLSKPNRRYPNVAKAGERQGKGAKGEVVALFYDRIPRTSIW